MNNRNAVPKALRNWFVVHFVVDIMFAIPLMIVPVFTLEHLGWTSTDPIVTRLVAAALFAIGIESLLSRNAGIETFQRMLNLKIIWSAGAIIGIASSQLELGSAAPLAGWGFLAVFAFFNILWGYWVNKLSD
jgi:hypothetical protein